MDSPHDERCGETTEADRTPAPTALDGLYASWLRSLRARNLSPATITTSTGARQFLDWLAVNAPEVGAPEQGSPGPFEVY